MSGLSGGRWPSGATSDIDQVTKVEYAECLEANLTDLAERHQRMAYRPQAVRRRYIPKPGSNKQQPLGIPTLEDKLVQVALVQILDRKPASRF